ncbi:MAG: tetratricopeptide repeat protein [Flavobacteriales bacterium]|nr:tetratricopeptide repeat protein [Flavobacteriales bacterium]
MRHLTILLFAAVLAGCDRQPKTAAPAEAPVLDELSTALQDMEQRILRDPQNAALYAERARLFERFAKPNEAIADWKRALAVDSANAAYHIALGDLYYHSLKVDEADAAFNKALALEPGNNEARLKVAEMKLMLRQYKPSMDLVNEALRSDPNLSHGYFLKGWIYMETGDTGRAISSYRTAVEQEPDNYRAWMELATLHAQRRDPLALQYYTTALSLQPNSVEAWYGKGLFAQENGRDSLALACYDSIKYIDPRNPAAWYNSGYVRLEHLNDALRAVKDFTAATKLAPKDVNAWYNRGLAYERKGSLDSAAADYRHALDLEPRYEPAAMGLQRLQDEGVKVKVR